MLLMLPSGRAWSGILDYWASQKRNGTNKTGETRRTTGTIELPAGLGVNSSAAPKKDK
jgi:hypothetical protein